MQVDGITDAPCGKARCTLCWRKTAKASRCARACATVRVWRSDGRAGMAPRRARDREPLAALLQRRACVRRPREAGVRCAALETERQVRAECACRLECRRWQGPCLDTREADRSGGV